MGDVGLWVVGNPHPLGPWLGLEGWELEFGVQPGVGHVSMPTTYGWRLWGKASGPRADGEVGRDCLGQQLDSETCEVTNLLSEL